jgi:hypothetical protein
MAQETQGGNFPVSQHVSPRNPNTEMDTIVIGGPDSELYIAYHFIINAMIPYID